MNNEEINIEQVFDAIANINPTDNWDLVFEQKLNKAKNSKPNKISIINIVVLIIVFINIGFVINSFNNENSEQEISRKNNFKIIADELLGSK